MQQTPVFDIIFLVARRAAGKSEIIDYLKRTEVDERLRRFHIGAFSEIDDFPMLWTWFEEDAILARMGKPRLHTDADGYFTGNNRKNRRSHRCPARPVQKDIYTESL